MVWKSSKKLGVGFSRMEMNGSEGWLMVFHYDPPGNIPGQFSINVIPAKIYGTCDHIATSTTRPITMPTTQPTPGPTTPTTKPTTQGPGTGDLESGKINEITVVIGKFSYLPFLRLEPNKRISSWLSIEIVVLCSFCDWKGL